MAVFVAGCSRQGQEAVAGNGKVDITFWDMAWGGGDAYLTQMKNLMDDMKKEYPKVGNIEYVTLTWANYFETIMTAIQSNTMPDIFTCGYGHAEMFARMGVVHYLDNLDKQYQGNLDKSFSRALWDSRRYEGHMVQVPWMQTIISQFYRKDMFEAVGYTSSPKTWDEFMDALRKVKAK
jgi:multiple sugar transport system substrate-binding protein